MENAAESRELTKGPSSKVPLSPNQKVIYDWFIEAINRTGAHPTCEETKTQFSISTDSASRYLREISDKGWLVRVKGHRFSFKKPDDEVAS